MHRGRVLLIVAVLLAAGTGVACAGSPVAAEPAEAAAAPRWTDVAAGFAHSCGVRNGKAYCWGANNKGQLGIGGRSLGQRETPWPVAGPTGGWTDVDAGTFHSCGIRNGSAYCWGDNANGQLGHDATAQMTRIPVPVDVRATNWASVSTGAYATCGVRTSDRLWCWGEDNLHHGGPLIGGRTPIQVAGSWSYVTVGGDHACAIKPNGRLFCWGDDEDGQLGNGPDDDTRENAPVQVDGQHTDWVDVSAGGAHTCGIRAPGSLWCWGRGVYGQLGIGNPPSQAPPWSSPIAIQSRSTDWVDVDAGAAYTCARRATNQLYCWGQPYDSQLGRFDVVTDYQTPHEVNAATSDYLSISAGTFHTCALRRYPSAVRAVCWGRAALGRLGNDEYPYAETELPLLVGPVP